tara:strand:+ start:42 stop:290 length:249 start_codon:yes stop_codon:yes gene_type:complete
MSFDKLVNDINDKYLSNTEIFPSEWQVKAIIKNNTFAKFIDGSFKKVNENYISLIHSNLVSSKKVYTRVDLCLPNDIVSHIM